MFGLQFIVGWHFHANALRVLRRGTANMDVLVSLGTNAAYLYSVVSVFHRRALHARGVEVDSMGFFETSALLITFISLGKYLEAHAKGKTSQVQECIVTLGCMYRLGFRMTMKAHGPNIAEALRAPGTEGAR